MKPGTDLRDHLLRQEARGAGGLLWRNAVRDAVQERSGEHVAGSGEVLGLAGKRRDVRLDAGMADVGSVGAVGDDR